MHAAVAVAAGDYRFDPREVTHAASRRWPDSGFVELSGISGRYSFGQVQVPSAVTGDEPFVLAAIHRSGGVISIDASGAAMIAQFVSCVAGIPGFPSGEVWLMEYATDPVVLRPGVTAEELLAARRC